MNPTTHPWMSIASDGLSAEINPMGAELSALRDAEGRDLLWGGDPSFWTGRAPILFPVVGMLAGGEYRLGARTYAMPKHGFARRRAFEVVEHDATSATFRLWSDEETLKVYPFAFQLDIRFEIAGAALSITASVRNPGETALPASLGFHPALRWPLPYGQSRSDHRIRFARPEPAPIRRIDQDGVVEPETYPTPVRGDVLALEDALFVDDAMIFDRIESRSLTYGAETGPQVEVMFPDTPYLGIWTKPGAGFICIEPWRGIADPQAYVGDFFEKPGVFQVQPGDTRRIGMSIALRTG